jgi:glycosyltransferase involved in cell wall biosynthesis
MIDATITTSQGALPSQSREQPTLSVILPNYNHGKLIARAITALLAQERPPDEIVVVDDGSTDDSVSVIRSLAAGSSIIRLITSTVNQGATAALSRGLDAASGTYVYFAAADDWVLPGFFASALAVFARHPEAGLVCGESYLVSGQTGEHLGVRPIVRPSNRATFFSPAETADLLRRADNWILTGSALFSRDRVVAAGGFVSELGSFADGYLARKVALRHGFCFVPRLMATWQVFDHSISRETAADPVETERVIARAVAYFANDAAFPRWYGDLFTRRLRFGAARLAVSTDPINTAVLEQAAARSVADRAFLQAALRWPSWRRPLRAFLLGWLWLRFWPMSPLLVLRSVVWRRFTRESS